LILALNERKEFAWDMLVKKDLLKTKKVLSERVRKLESIDY